MCQEVNGFKHSIQTPQVAAAIECWVVLLWTHSGSDTMAFDLFFLILHNHCKSLQVSVVIMVIFQLLISCAMNRTLLTSLTDSVFIPLSVESSFES